LAGGDEDDGAEEVAFSFEGRRLAARRGQSLAAALIAAGERTLRQTAKGQPRSVFCGMGVCHDCLVEIDGAPNRRACMEKATPGLTVRRQPALARLDGVAPAAPGAVQVARPDVLVVGGGAGGLEAALAAASAGAGVLVLDERPAPGGQYYKQAVGAAPLDAQQRAGAALVDRARAAGAELRMGVEVWGAFDGPVLAAAEGDDALIVRPRAVVIATGAYERPLMVPGWDLPGVMTTGAAQTLWRTYRTLPGARVIVAGSGPLNLQVALEVARGGARLAAVCEAAPAPFTRLGSAARMAAADPALAARGALMLAGLAARGVRLRHGTVLERIERSAGSLAVTLAGAHRRSTLLADAVLMNDGFQPANEILRLLGCAMDWDARLAQLRPVRAADGETSVAGIYAVGDCCGLGGAPAAAAEGAIAGAAAARSLGFAAPDPQGARVALRRARAFQDALWRLYGHPPHDLSAVPPETVFCRCEEVTKGELDAALAEAGDIGAVKRATRIGMGRCQGRYCGPALARLLAERRHEALTERSFFAPRAPIKPVRIATVAAAQAAIDALGSTD